MKQNLKSNKGFSLVELIIVIAIMAILVGVMAPQLIKYIEKTKVSSDIQLCDTLKSAIVITLSDPEFISSTDTNDALWAQDFTNPGEVNSFPAAISTGRANAIFYKNVTDICGFDFVSYHEFKSTPARSSGILCYAVSGTGNDFAIFINNSDINGEKIGHSVSGVGSVNPQVYDDIDTYDVIFVK